MLAKRCFAVSNLNGQFKVKPLFCKVAKQQVNNLIKAFIYQTSKKLSRPDKPLELLYAWGIAMKKACFTFYGLKKN